MWQQYERNVEGGNSLYFTGHLLKRLLQRPAILRGGLVTDVYAKDNPALFLRLLCQTYRSHFFCASEAEAA